LQQGMICFRQTFFKQFQSSIFELSGKIRIIANNKGSSNVFC
jgi:hypothetical protein